MAAFLLSEFFLNNQLIFHVTVNDYLTFSYPSSFEVKDIFINEQVYDDSVEASRLFKKPLPTKFTDFTSLEGKFSFKYPAEFSIIRQDFPGSDILYHVDIHDKKQIAHGFVQVWHMPYSLSEFLERSRKQSQMNFTSFVTRPYEIDKEQGYLWDYSFIGSDGVEYKGMETFFKKDERMFRVSYFISADLWNKSQLRLYQDIVKSFKAKD